MISLSYSRISLADIAQKLQLDSPEDAEFIVAKVGLVQGPWSALSCLISGGERSRRLATEGREWRKQLSFFRECCSCSEARRFPERLCECKEDKKNGMRCSRT